MPRLGSNSRCSRPVTRSTLIGVNPETGVFTTRANAFTIVQGVLRTVP